MRRDVGSAHRGSPGERSHILRVGEGELRHRDSGGGGRAEHGFHSRRTLAKLGDRRDRRRARRSGARPGEHLAQDRWRIELEEVVHLVPEPVRPVLDLAEPTADFLGQRPIRGSLAPSVREPALRTCSVRFAFVLLACRSGIAGAPPSAAGESPRMSFGDALSHGESRGSPPPSPARPCVSTATPTRGRVRRRRRWSRLADLRFVLRGINADNCRQFGDNGRGPNHLFAAIATEPPPLAAVGIEGAVEALGRAAVSGFRAARGRRRGTCPSRARSRLRMLQASVRALLHGGDLWCRLGLWFNHRGLQLFFRSPSHRREAAEGFGLSKIEVVTSWCGASARLARARSARPSRAYVGGSPAPLPGTRECAPRWTFRPSIVVRAFRLWSENVADNALRAAAVRCWLGLSISGTTKATLRSRPGVGVYGLSAATLAAPESVTKGSAISQQNRC